MLLQLFAALAFACILTLTAELVLRALARADSRIDARDVFQRVVSIFFRRVMGSPRAIAIVCGGILLVSLPAYAQTGGAPGGNALADALPLAALILGGVTTIVHMLHSIGLSHVVSGHLRDLASQPGNKLAPVEAALAAHIDAGDDEAALSLLKGVLGTVGKK